MASHCSARSSRNGENWSTNGAAMDRYDGLELLVASSLVCAVVLLGKYGLIVSLAYYPLLGLTSAMLFLMVVSTFSHQASLDLISAGFLVIWAPLSIVLDCPFVPGELTMTPLYSQASFKLIPTWARQCIFHFLVCAWAEENVSYSWGSWIFSLSITTHLIAMVGMYDQDSFEDITIFMRSLPRSVIVISEVVAILCLTSYSLWTTSLVTLVTSSMFYAMTSALSKAWLIKHLASFYFDFFDGLERDYAEATVLLVDICLHLCLFTVGLLTTDVYMMTLSCVSVSCPIHDVTTRVWGRIQSERRALFPFPRAGIKEILNHDDVCPVCLSTMSSARVTPCGHLFHGKCLSLSLKEKPVCPLCIQSIDMSTSPLT